MKNKRFSIQEYLKENKITLGPLKREIGNTVYKGGHNDLRKTNYDVRLDKNGKLDLYTHKTIITEESTLNEAVSNPNTGELSAKLNVVPKINIILKVEQQHKTSKWLVAKCFAKGDALIMINALNSASPDNYKYIIGK